MITFTLLLCRKKKIFFFKSAFNVFGCHEDVVKCNIVNIIKKRKDQDNILFYVFDFLLKALQATLKKVGQLVTNWQLA